MENVDNYAELIKAKIAMYLPDILGAVLILVLGWFAAKILTALARRLLRRAKVDDTLTAFAANLLYMGLIALVVIAALGRLGVDTTSFAAIIAAAGLAIGFALQGSLANFAAGVMLIFFRPFKVGDLVEVGGVTGDVKEIQVFATVLNTKDNKRIVMGNAAITGDTIINYSANDTRRVDMVFGIGYDDDIRKAKEILERIVAEDERVLAEPAPKVALSELADSSVNFVVRPWCKTEDYWNVYYDVHERVKATFDAEGVSIPFPQRDVHLHQVAA